MQFSRMRACVPLLVVILLGAGEARASYILRALSDGASTVSVAPGGSFNLDFALTSDGADEHNSAIFRVVFSQPGLLCNGYTWHPAYDPTFDDSKPNSGFDVPLNVDTLTGLGYPDGVVDIELSNVVGDGTFTAGTIATVSLTVPLSYSGSSPITINVAPDATSNVFDIVNGFDYIPTVAGEDFVLNIPEPTSAAVLLLGGAALLRRRAGGRRRR